MTDLSKEGDTLGYAAQIPEIHGKCFLHNQRIRSSDPNNRVGRFYKGSLYSILGINYPTLQC